MNSTVNFITNFLVVGFIIYYFGVQFGLFQAISPLDYDYNKAKNLIDTCSIEHKNLLDTTNKYEELTNLDINRAYNECREDLRGIRNNHFTFGYFSVILGLIGIYLTWRFTRDYYKPKKKEADFLELKNGK
jgi:hypothetical protein